MKTSGVKNLQKSPKLCMQDASLQESPASSHERDFPFVRLFCLLVFFFHFFLKFLELIHGYDFIYYQFLIPDIVYPYFYFQYLLCYSIDRIDLSRNPIHYRRNQPRKLLSTSAS